MPEISQIAILFLLYHFNDLCESGFVVDGKIGEDFAVDIDVFRFHAGDELGIRDPKFARGIVDAGDPEGAKVAFLVPAITIGITKGLDDALFAETETAGAVMLHPFGCG